MLAAILFFNFNFIAGIYRDFFVDKNLSIDYTIGLNWFFAIVTYEYTLLKKILFILYIVFLGLLVIATFSDKKSTRNRKLVFLTFSPIVALYPFLLFASTFALIATLLLPVIYTTSNLIHQDIFNISFWKYEIGNGFLAIRILSVSIFVYIFLLIKQQRAYAAKNKRSKKRDLKSKELVAKNRAMLKNMYFDKSVTPTIDLLKQVRTLQYIFVCAYYNLVLLFVIFSLYFDVNNFSIAIISWGLLFIVDDWKVISDYTLEYSKPVLFWHSIKLKSLDLLLLVCVIVASFSMFSVASALTTALIVTFAYLILFLTTQYIEEMEYRIGIANGETSRITILSKLFSFYVERVKTNEDNA